MEDRKLKGQVEEAVEPTISQATKTKIHDTPQKTHTNTMTHMIHRRTKSHAMQKLDRWSVLHGRIGHDQTNPILPKLLKQLVGQHSANIPPLMTRGNPHPPQQAAAMLSFPLLCDGAEYESDDPALRVSKSNGGIITTISTPLGSNSNSAITVALEELFRHEAELTIAAQVLDHFERIPRPVQLGERVGCVETKGWTR